MDLKSVKKMYKDNIEKHGSNSLAVGWTSEESHFCRFDQFKRILELNGEVASSISIGDYGCGYGALYNYLESSQYSISRYHGVDIVSEMIDKAAINLSNKENIELEISKSSPSNIDYVFVSGTFNNVNDLNKEEWKEYLFSTLRELFESSNKGVIFNLLTSYVDWEEGHLFYGAPEEFFKFGRSLTKKVNILHDYPLYEWTMAYLK